MIPVFTSELATEMTDYLNMLCEAGKDTGHIQNALKGLDQYLKEHNHTGKMLPDEAVSLWIATRKVHSNTKAGNISSVKGFVKYLVSLGFEASAPDRVIKRFDYVPYVFSEEEWMRIVSFADNFGCGLRPVRSAKIYPVLLRILYGCGLRLSEGLSLRWTDLDLTNGIITIRQGKNLKQRLVPMNHSLTALLLLYKDKTLTENICSDYLFESDFSFEKHFDRSSFYRWFAKILKKATIYYSKHSKQNRNERGGPCPHCLRHTFVLRSFLKSENEGRKFEDTSPFLSAYLGHDSLRETDKYLHASHLVYTDSHKRVNDYIGNLIPEVCFDED